MSLYRVSGWILPDGTWVECKPWEHVRAAKQHAWVVSNRDKVAELDENWDHEDEERLRACLGRLGLIKVCYHLVDADSFNLGQLRMLQKLYALFPPEQEIEFIGRIRLRLEVRLLLKIKNPDRLNFLGDFG